MQKDVTFHIHVWIAGISLKWCVGRGLEHIDNLTQLGGCKEKRKMIPIVAFELVS
jgi:hypothetical protein